MKIITHRPGEAQQFKLVRKVFPYRGAYRWIVTDETTQGYGMVLAHGRRRRYMEARREAALAIKTAGGKVGK
jgi:hypothetical protein